MLRFFSNHIDILILGNQVPVPYYINVPETKYRTETIQVPVPKTKVEMDTVSKTVYDTQVRTRCVPQTTMVSKQIPVYNVVARPAPPCPPGADCGMFFSCYFHLFVYYKSCQQFAPKGTYVPYHSYQTATLLKSPPPN